MINIQASWAIESERATAQITEKICFWEMFCEWCNSWNTIGIKHFCGFIDVHHAACHNNIKYQITLYLTCTNVSVYLMFTAPNRITASWSMWLVEEEKLLIRRLDSEGVTADF